MDEVHPVSLSAMVGLPFVLVGVVVLAGGSNISADLGVPPLLYGGFIVLVGLYVHFVVDPSTPTLQDDELIVASRQPVQRVAIAKTTTGLPCLLLAGYLIAFTTVPYIYPTIALLIGLYFLSTGLYLFWTNTLTWYYVTTDRVIKEYQFFSQVRQEVPLDKVRGVQERKTLTEMVVGLGTVRVASGGGQSLEIRMRNMDDPTEFAEEIRLVM